MLTAAHYNANPAALKAGDIVVGKNASKAAQITANDGKQITLVFGTHGGRALRSALRPFAVGRPADRQSFLRPPHHA